MRLSVGKRSGSCSTPLGLSLTDVKSESTRYFRVIQNHFFSLLNINSILLRKLCTNNSSSKLSNLKQVNCFSHHGEFFPVDY